MATAGNEHVIRYFEEGTFGSGPGDWSVQPAFYCLEPNLEEIRQEALENGNYRARAWNPHPMVPGRRNGTLSFGLYWHGRGTADVAAEDANATTFAAPNFMRNAWGGRRLGRCSGVDTHTGAAVAVDAGEGGSYRPGDWMFLMDPSDSNRGRFCRVESVATDDITLLFAAPVDLPDDGSATSGAVIVSFLHTRALINRAHAEHVTHSFHQVRDPQATDDVVEARGVKLNLTGIDAIESGGEPVLRFEGMSATHQNEGLVRPADPATIAGDAPLVVSQGSDTFVSIGDVGSDLAVIEAHAVTVTPGVASAPVEGVGGIEGRHGYHGTGFEGTRIEIVVPHDDAFQQEWEDRTPRHLLLQIGTTQGRAVGLYMPNMLLAEDPMKSTSQDLATCTLVYEAYEFEGDELSGLSGDALEQYRSKIQMLFSA